jgi:hypothetical protein
MPAATHTAAKKPKPSSGLDTPDAVTQPSDSLPNPVASPVIVSAPTPADEEPKSSMDMPTAMVSLEEIQKEVAPDINMIVKNKDSVATAAETTDEQAGRASEKPTEMVSLDETLAAIEERRRAESGTHENVHHGDADTVARDAPFAAPKDSLLGDEAPELKEVTVSVEEGESSSSGKIKILLAAIVVLTGGALFGIYMYLNQDAGAPPSAPDPAAQNAEASPPTGEGANAPGDDAGGALAETDGGQGAPAKADGGEKAAVAAAFDVYDFKLSTKPEGASILIDDEEVGTTPAAIREKSSNLPRKMTFALSGHISKEISLTPEGFAADGKLTPVTAEAQEKNPNRAVIKVLVELDREIVEEPVVEKVIEEPKPKKRRRRTAKKSKKKKSADKPSKEDPKTKDDLKTEPEPDLFEAPKEDDGINLF